MSNCLFCIMAMVFSGSIYGQGRLEVIVNNIKPQKGAIRVGLFNNSGDFLERAIEGKVVPVSSSEVMVLFENLSEGEYAISVIHDENENEKLDTNFLGIPKEGFAFGNNAMGMFGPPDFDKAKVSIDKSTVKQVIRLKYM